MQYTNVINIIYGIVLCKNTHNTNTAFYDYQILKFVLLSLYNLTYCTYTKTNLYQNNY